MVKLYCLSYRFRVRWSFSGEFHCYNDAIKWLMYSKLHFYWNTDIKFYKLIHEDGDIEYITVEKPHQYDSDNNILISSTLDEICSFTGLYPTLLL